MGRDPTGSRPDLAIPQIGAQPVAVPCRQRSRWVVTRTRDWWACSASSCCSRFPRGRLPAPRRPRRRPRWPPRLRRLPRPPPRLPRPRPRAAPARPPARSRPARRRRRSPRRRRPRRPRRRARPLSSKAARIAAAKKKAAQLEGRQDRGGQEEGRSRGREEEGRCTACPTRRPAAARGGHRRGDLRTGSSARRRVPFRRVRRRLHRRVGRRAGGSAATLLTRTPMPAHSTRRRRTLLRFRCSPPWLRRSYSLPRRPTRSAHARGGLRADPSNLLRR